MRKFAWLPAFLAAGAGPCVGPTGSRASFMKTSARARRAWAARSWPSPTMRRRAGGIRRGSRPGPYFNLVFEKGRVDRTRKSCPTDDPVAPGRAPAASRSRCRRSVSATTACGSVKSRRSTTGAPRRGPTTAGGMLRCASRAISQFGVTIGQSLGNHLVVGSTVKLVRAGSASAPYDRGHGRSVPTWPTISTCRLESHGRSGSGCRWWRSRICVSG